MMPPPPSITDVSSASASFTSGAKMSGMNLAGPRETPDFMTQLMSRNSTTTTATLPQWVMPAGIVAVVAVVTVFLLKRKK